MAVGGVHVFLYRPAERAMVENEVGAVLGTAGVLGLNLAGHVFLADAEAHVAHDEVLRAAEVDLVAGDDDAFAGSRLSGQGPVGAVHAQFTREGDVAADREHDCQRIPLVLLESPAQGAFRAVVFQRGNGHHLATAAAGCELSETLGSREREGARRLDGLDGV